MNTLYAPLHYIMTRRARAKQKRNALHMMALSGVIRPSHLELRYGIPPTTLDAFRSQFTVTDTLRLNQRSSTQAWHHDIHAGVQRTWQWMRTISKTAIHLSRKPISPQWNVD